MSAQMNFRAALLAAAAVLPSLASAQTANVWSNPANALPTQSVMVGGPWTLGSGAVFSGPTPYCVNGTQNPNANPAPGTVMAPYYFPYVLGSGNNLYGYFDYRPSSLNEITVAAKSTDAGKTWNFLQEALQITSACPSSDSPNGTDTGLGHPYLLNFGGSDFLYLLDRRGGHVDVDGLVVKRITPTVSAPLHAKPALNTTVVQSFPLNLTGIIAGWTFDGLETQVNVNPPADVGPKAATAKAIPLGMNNGYFCSATPNTSSTAAGVGSEDGEDVESDSGSAVSPSNAWRVRGLATTDFSFPCNGWSLDAPQLSQGAQFNVDTTGVADVLLQFDWYSTKQGIRDMVVQYSTDVTAATPVWTTQQAGYLANPKGWQDKLVVNFTGVPGVGNNPNFGVRFVAVYDAGLPAGSYVDSVSGTMVNYAAGQEYAGANLTSGKPTIYNNNSGNWRFDNVLFFDATKYSTTAPTGKTDYSVETTGLLNPDGILAAIPNTSPRKVLYVEKQLGVAPSATACPAAGASGSINSDVDTIRLAQTTDGIHFTDLGAVNGLTNPSTIANNGLRYAAPNGSIVKYANGKLGLFFGTGNCEDGDSDGFHIIAYAENTDSTYLNWTVVNGYDNPIGNVAFGQAPAIAAPLLGTSSQTNGAQNYWFGGRVYTPNAIYKDANDISLIFAGYNYGYFGTDLSSYRTIGQITLHSSNTLVP